MVVFFFFFFPLKLKSSDVHKHLSQATKPSPIENLKLPSALPGQLTPRLGDDSWSFQTSSEDGRTAWNIELECVWVCVSVRASDKIGNSTERARGWRATAITAVTGGALYVMVVFLLSNSPRPELFPLPSTWLPPFEIHHLGAGSENRSLRKTSLNGAFFFFFTLQRRIANVKKKVSKSQKKVTRSFCKWNICTS